ncbi:hypothetical protein BDV23DRAFT_176312 [Aspergillus alliaceus]|uniref:TauD/TfdA-like domain-containing protein n=1 Tax=Petromyces alliaceus TaxID=209559 RepID=A0A5N7BUE4_PETAA|nr:hypothetical protein BDV23DRAFT_176312 [Aspergillus alliaceus]
MTIQPLEKVPGSAVDFGAQIDNVDLEDLTNDEFSKIRDILYHQHIVVFKNQHGLSSKAQYELTKRFDPGADHYGHDNIIDGESTKLHGNFKPVVHQPQVQVKGNGFVESYEGLHNIQLLHPHHRNFHRDCISEDKEHEFTRFYRWHIDAALYDLYPPKVTTLMAVRVPKGRRQLVLYDDGSGETLDASLATTAFVSGNRMFEMLSPEDQQFVKTSSVEYAPHPHVWRGKARSFSNGLRLYSEGHELSESDLPSFDRAKIQILPMVWKNPVTRKLALQIHAPAVRRIHLQDGSVIDDLARIRDIVYRLQRPAISPQYVYAHDWSEGDLVLFNNHGMLHTVVGTLQPDEIRLFRQCNLAASEPPEGP